ncbi:MAG TPA: OmpA family protein [Kofleriaceae bacterium]|jgi:peptidoglycan-associated lipoprotein|nr:OmpA family protein [Kofleriaceae bacterium]
MHRSFSAFGGAILVAVVALVLGFAMTSCGDSSKKPGCTADKDCKTNLVCAANTCVECTSDAQCTGGKRCTGNACVLAPECERDDQCQGGKVCQAGKCKACASDSECPSGTCSAGACATAKKCSKDNECADDEDCVNGLCRKATAGAAGDAPCALSTVYFAFDASSVQASERDRLTANVACLDKAKGKHVYLIGHTDTSGTEEYNIALSERRAQAVADYMARLGCDPARLQVVPKGETEPTGLGDDKDRRVEFQWH